MEKLVYLLWGAGDDASGDALRERLLVEAAPALAEHARGVGVNVHDAAAAEAPSPVPTPEGEHPHVAEVSLWVDAYDRRGPVDDVVAAVGLRSAGYLVVESLVDDYGTTPHGAPRTWPDGARSPGVLTVALIHRPDGLAYDEWIRRWHGTQSPLSGRIQPRVRYVRNEVVRAVTADAPPIDGIVEEAWPSARHVVDPLLFYGAADDRQLAEHVSQMLDSVNACLDLGRLRSTTMSEYLLKTV